MSAKQVYTLDLKTSGLISGYKNAIKQMEQAGASADITKGLTTSLNKLEEKYRQLKAEGEAGFTNSKDIENYRKRVDRLMSSFRTFEVSLSNVGGNIGKLATRSKEAGVKIEKAFSNLKISDSAKAMNEVLAAEDKIKAASQIIEKELETRVKKVDELKVKYEEAAAAAATSTASAKNSGADKLGKTYTNSGNTQSRIFSNSASDARKNEVLAAAADAIKATDNIEQAWAQMEQYIADHDLAKYFTQAGKYGTTGLDGLRKNMEAVFTEATRVAQEEAAKVQAIEEEVAQAVAEATEIGKQNKDGTFSVDKSKITEVTAAIRERISAQEKLNQALGAEAATDETVENALNGVNSAAHNVAGSAMEAQTSFDSMATGLENTAKNAENTASTFEQMKQKLLMFFSVTSLFNGLRNQIKQTFNDVKTLDKSFASIAMVTQYSVNEMWSSYGQYADMAAQLGQKTNSVIQASALFYQQGLGTNEALELTTDTMKLATLAGNDFQTATQEMTSALRGFKMEMDEGGHVTDVYSELAAHAAASVDDIAQAMARTASIANSAGMSFENTSAFLTQMIETTQESAENIGTSLKTIIARFTELKENVAGTADSEFEDLDFNKVDKALKSVGVQLKDTTGQFRNLDEVFLELSEKWDTLDRNTQRYVATVAAGSRQQSRFIAMMDNYDRTVELMDLAADAEGKADEQFAKYADTMEYKLNQLSTKWEEFRVNLLDSDAFKGIIDTVTEIVNRLQGIKLDNMFDVAKITAGVIIVIKAVKNNIMTFLNNAKVFSASAQKLGQAIGQKVMSGFNSLKNKYLKNDPIKFQVDLKNLQSQLKVVENRILQMRQKYGNNTYNILVKSDPKVLDELVTKFNNGEIHARDLAEEVGLTVDEIAKLGGADNLSALAENFQNAEEEAQGLHKEIDLDEESLKNIESANQKFGQLMSTTFNAATTSVMGYASGMMTAGEAITAFLGQIGLLLAQMALQIAMDKIVEKVKIAKAGASTVAAGAQTAETAAATAGTAANGALAVSEWAVLWPLLLVVAAFAALALVIIGAIALFKHFADAESESEKRARELEEAVNAAAEAKENMANAKEKASSLKEEVKNAESLKQEYDELTKLQKAGIISDEQQQRLNEIQQEIVDTMPEIVEYYNEETHQLEVQNDLWEQKLEYQKQMAAEAERVAGISSVVYYESEKDVVGKQADKQTRELEKNIGYNGWQSYVTSEEVDLKTFLSDQKKAYANTTAREAFENLAANFVNVEELAKYFTAEDINTMTDDELEQLYAEMLDTTNEGWTAIEHAYSSIDEAAQKQIDMYDSFIENERATALAEVTGVDEAVASAVVSATKDYDASDDIEAFSNFVHDFDNDGPDADKADNNEIVTWDALDADQQAIVQGMGYDRESWNDLDVEDEDVVKSLYDKYQKAATEYWTQKFGEEVINNMDDATKTAIVDFKDSTVGATDSEIQKEVEKLKEAYQNDSGLTDEQKASLVASADTWGTEAINSLNEKKDELRNILSESVYASNLGKNTEGNIYLGQWDTEQIEAFTAQLSLLSDTYGELAAADYGAQVMASAEKMNLDPDQITQLMTIDWSQMTLEGADEFEASTIEMFKEMGIEDAEAFYNEMQKYADTTGMINLSINTEDAFDEFIETIDEARDKVESLGDDIVSAVEDLTEAGEISFSNFQSLSDSLSDLGLSVYDYVNIDDNGKITATQEDLEQLYKDQLEAQQLKLEQQLLENKAEEAELQLQLTNLENARDQIESGGQMITTTISERDATYEWALAMEAVADQYDRITGHATARTSIRDSLTFSVTNDSDKDALLQSIDSQILATKTRLETIQGINENLQKQADNGESYKAAALRNYNSELNEAKGLTTDVASAQEEYNDALEEYDEQLETVAEKQENLNEKIQEYNELLYGSDNRKSSLDFLYNYDEAINSFNDEISRSKDLLADATSIEESADALQRYADATHNLIAEETAKQRVISAGLANYADKIENGSYSYTNSETGEVTNINFGDYAKKDERTGKYIIDQRLLEEARFGDDFKDLLEEQVSNYNSYSEKLLESEDNVRKAEKELQDERNNARKNYAAMETEIADALKAQYESEVNALKDKYDAMKNADDDYLDALQDAIDKQRALRDQENAYEDLAEQEKKLSLMQRDTSGANQVEALELEKDIQQTREELLDEAIDNVIEGLSDLYESQQELRDSEIELKEALVDNTLYWNTQAEALAGSFNSAEEYAEFLSSLSEEYSMMTLAQQQDKLQEYSDTYTAASEYMAMQAMDTASTTGDFIVETLTVNSEEVGTIVTNTAETFTTEVTRAYNETTKAFEKDMADAEQSIADAKDELQEAINKLNECAQAANDAAAALKAAQDAENANNSENGENADNSNNGPSTLYGLINSYGVRHEALDDIANKYEGVEEEKAMIGQISSLSSDMVNELADKSSLSKEEIVEDWLNYHRNQASAYASKAGINGNAISDAAKKLSDEDFIHWVATQIANKKFEQGGLVNFTGPAWVDGSPDKPEAFLSAEDTARIGDAAKILSDIPWMDRETDNASVVTNNGGDVNVEINLNIDHISSETDIDEMMERVKEEIVEVARPTGTNVILQQQL